MSDQTPSVQLQIMCTKEGDMSVPEPKSIDYLLRQFQRPLWDDVAKSQFTGFKGSVASIYVPNIASYKWRCYNVKSINSNGIFGRWPKYFPWQISWLFLRITSASARQADDWVITNDNFWHTYWFNIDCELFLNFMQVLRSGLRSVSLRTKEYSVFLRMKTSQINPLSLPVVAYLSSVH